MQNLFSRTSNYFAPFYDIWYASKGWRVENSFANLCNEWHCPKMSDKLFFVPTFSKDSSKSAQMYSVYWPADSLSLCFQPSLFRIFEILLSISVSSFSREFKKSLKISKYTFFACHHFHSFNQSFSIQYVAIEILLLFYQYLKEGYEHVNVFQWGFTVLTLSTTFPWKAIDTQDTNDSISTNNANNRAIIAFDYSPKQPLSLQRTPNVILLS